VYFEYICWKFAGRLLDRVYIHPITDVEETDKLQTLRETADDDDGGGVFVPRITLRPLPPLFLVSIWNVHVATLNGDDRTRRGIGASLRWSVVTTRWCGAPSSHCTRMRPRRRRRCCRMHVASCRQNISRCPPGFCNVFCCIYCCMCDINTFGYLLKFDHYVSDEIQLKEMSDERQNRPILSADKIA